MRLAHIGDFVIWLDAAKEFRTLYPKEKITFVSYDYKNVEELARRTGYFDEIFMIATDREKKYMELWKWRKKAYRVVINANPSRSDVSDFLVMAVMAEDRIAPVSDHTFLTKRQRKRSDRIYTKLVSCGDTKTMELIRNAQFMRGLGACTFQAGIPVLPVMDMPLNIEQNGMVTDYRKEEYFVICAGGETSFQYWEEEKFAEVIAHILHDKSKLTCILLGVKKERASAEQILAVLKNKNVWIDECNIDAKIISLVGKTDLLEYIEWIRGARFVISNDTSAVHIAAAVQTKAVVIAAGWNAGRFHPYQVEKQGQECYMPIAVHARMACMGCGLKKEKMITGCVINGRRNCIHSIEVKQVLQAYEKISAYIDG